MKNQIATYILLKEKLLTLNFFLKSNLFASDGKVAQLNKRINYCVANNKQLRFEPLGLSIQSSSSLLHEELKQCGLLTELKNDSIHMYFPITINFDELEEVLSIVEKVIKNPKDENVSH